MRVRIEHAGNWSAICIDRRGGADLRLVSALVLPEDLLRRRTLRRSTSLVPGEDDAGAARAVAPRLGAAACCAASRSAPSRPDILGRALAAWRRYRTAAGRLRHPRPRHVLRLAGAGARHRVGLVLHGRGCLPRRRIYRHGAAQARSRRSPCAPCDSATRAGRSTPCPSARSRRLTNASRDWATVKFNIRLDRSADVEKARKTIKKMGFAMLEDPEIGRDFILAAEAAGRARDHRNRHRAAAEIHRQAGAGELPQREALKRVSARSTRPASILPRTR